MKHCLRWVASLFYVTVITFHEVETLRLRALSAELLRMDPHLDPILVLFKTMLIVTFKKKYFQTCRLIFDNLGNRVMYKEEI